MKKIVSLCVAVCLCVTMLFSAVTSVSAEIVITDKTADLSKSVRVGDDTSGITMALTSPGTASGSMLVDISNYSKLFMTGENLKTGALWLKGAILALKDSNNTFLALAKGKKYSINVLYDVTRVDTEDSNYYPQIGLGYNNNTTLSNAASDNGTIMLAAKKHGAVGTYSFSVVVDGTKVQPLRLVFGGDGAFEVKSVNIREVTQTADKSKNIDLSLSSPINVTGPTYSNFIAATDTEPMKLDVNCSTKNQFFDGANNWVNSWTKLWVKSLVTLKYDANSFATIDANRAYTVTVKYKVTSISEAAQSDLGLYPEIAVVYNNGNNMEGDNGTYVIAGARVAPANENKELTLTADFYGNKKGGFPIRLAFAGQGSFEISSVTVAESEALYSVTLQNDGVSKTEYYSENADLEVPVKEGYSFKGWFTADGIRVEKATGNMTVTAAWIKEGNIDLSKSEKINGDKANMTITAPTSESGNLKVDISGYNKLIFNGDTVKAPIWAGGALVSLNYADGSFAGLKSASKYVINVDYDVTNVRTGNALYYPQIAVVYNNNTSDSNTLKDNGSYALAVKKHSKIGSYSLSCVVSGKDSNALRLLFDGEGVFSVKSVSVSEFSSDVTGISAVKYAGGIYNSENAVFAVNGSVLPTLPQNPAANFGGWYNGDTKVVTVSGDAELTAKWYDKTDLNMDNKTDVIDLIKIKKALASSSDDLFFDVLRNGKVGAGDITAVKKYLLGNEVIAVNGEDLSSYKVRQGNMQSFMTSEAIASLIGSVEDAFEITLPMTAEDEVNENEIVVGLTGSSADNAAAETATGINGDTYKADEYKIFFVGNKLYVEAGSDYATAYAVNKLIDYLTLYRTIPTGFTLSGEYGGDYSLLDGYAYVWGDEFDGATLNKSLWTVETGEQAGTYYTRNNSYYSGSVASLWDSDSTNDYGGPWIDVEDSPQMQDGTIMLLDDEGNNYGLNNGLLTMKTAKTATGYSATKISANVSFKFGIMTARVKIGTKNGACTTLWSRTVDNGGASVNEMDFVENYGKDQILPNLHTWKNYTESVNHGALNEIALRNTVTPADGESLSDSFHDIALKWTDKKITFYFDGKVYLEQDIAADAEKWEAFQKSTYLIMGISAPKADYCNYGGSKPGDILGSMINTFAESTSVDYIRIFQNKNGTLTNK